MKKILILVLMTAGMAGALILPAPVQKEPQTQVITSTSLPDIRLDAKRLAGIHRKPLKTSRHEVRKPAKIKKPSQKIHKKPTKTKKVHKTTKVSLSGIAACIAKYESNGNPRAQNPRSSASGLYQFIDGTWHAVTGLPGSAKDYPASVQTKAFYKLWDNGRGAHHWVTAHRCM